MRHRLISHPTFQYSFILSFVVGVLFIVCVLGLTSWGTLLYASKSLQIAEYQRTILQHGANQMLAVIFITTLLLVGIIAGFGLFLSYRFIGPLSRLETWAEKCLAGEAPPPLMFSRKKDELGHAIELLSKIMEKQKKRKG